MHKRLCGSGFCLLVAAKICNFLTGITYASITIQLEADNFLLESVIIGAEWKNLARLTYGAIMTASFSSTRDIFPNRGCEYVGLSYY